MKDNVAFYIFFNFRNLFNIVVVTCECHGSKLDLSILFLHQPSSKSEQPSGALLH